MIRFAIDPGTGTSSACGICIYDPIPHRIIVTLELWPSLKKPTWMRIRDMQRQVRDLMAEAHKIHGPLEVRSEKFVMRGQGGETLSRFIGGIIANIPDGCLFNECHNIVLKRSVSGNAKAEKLDMGLAILKQFPNQIDLVQKLIDNKAWDAIDAVAIAICKEVIDQ